MSRHLSKKRNWLIKALSDFCDLQVSVTTRSKIFFRFAFFYFNNSCLDIYTIEGKSQTDAAEAIRRAVSEQLEGIAILPTLLDKYPQEIMKNIK